MEIVDDLAVKDVADVLDELNKQMRSYCLQLQKHARGFALTI